MVDLLLGIAWLVIVLTPALLASLQPVVSDRYVDFTADDLTKPQPALSRSRKR
jgi:hypothetical protein